MSHSLRCCDGALRTYQQQHRCDDDAAVLAAANPAPKSKQVQVKRAYDSRSPELYADLSEVALPGMLCSLPWRLARHPRMGMSRFHYLSRPSNSARRNKQRQSTHILYRTAWSLKTSIANHNHTANTHTEPPTALEGAWRTKTCSNPEGYGPSAECYSQRRKFSAASRIQRPDRVCARVLGLVRHFESDAGLECDLDQFR